MTVIPNVVGWHSLVVGWHSLNRRAFWCCCPMCTERDTTQLHDRAMRVWCLRRHITVEHRGPDKMVEVRCGRLCWHELGFSFPSELLVAKVALAVEAGRHREIEGMGD